MVLIITLVVFIAVALITWALMFYFFGGKTVVQDRLDRLTPKPEFSVERREKTIPFGNSLGTLGAKIPLSPKEHSKYAQMLVAAGFRKEHVYPFMGSKIILAICLPLLYPIYLVMSTLHGETFREALFKSQPLLVTAALAILGFLLPSYWLYYMKNKRQTQIFHTLPDIHDLLTVCVEAGLSLDAALIRVTETPQFEKDPLAQEIRIATRETRAGKPRMDALKDMAERTMVDDVKSFVIMLAQTEKFGTSLGQSLRVHAESLRTKRRQLAEEAAAKTTIKLVFPLAIFIFPALLVVMLGSAFIQVMGIFG
ncbi:MAG: type II secretion system F family protein [Deltaproteobacteria bacterium]|nr:type II secretion system F family protein [Deltaproteobacteria bacterium]TLN03233.1 MAG: type II secretion system F family protein [bacterium]